MVRVLYHHPSTFKRALLLSARVLYMTYSASRDTLPFVSSCGAALSDKRSTSLSLQTMDAHHHASPASRPSLDKIEDRDDDGDDDDDLDPAKFLQSVRELSHQREREDSERYRKLEEEVEKGRQERLARRAGGSPLHVDVSP